jgi:LemA protein
MELYIGLTVLVMIIWVIAIYNGIIKNFNAVKRAWSNIIAQETQKQKTIPNLEKITKEYKEFEQGLFEKVTALRSGVAALDENSIDIKALEKVELATQNVLRGIHLSMEAYPDLKANQVVQNLMREIVEQQENITAAIRILNQNIEIFNNFIQIFPNFIVNGLLNRKKKFESYTDSKAEAEYEYNPFL